MNYITSSDTETKKFGEEIAKKLQGGQVIELVGDVGAGKTTLAKGIASGLGVEEELQSPSFTLSRVYDLPGGGKLAHYDFYRLSDPGILADELADVTSHRDTITIIEWAEIVEDVLPKSRVTVRISAASESSRSISLEGL